MIPFGGIALFTSFLILLLNYLINGLRWLLFGTSSRRTPYIVTPNRNAVIAFVVFFLWSAVTLSSIFLIFHVATNSINNNFVVIKDFLYTCTPPKPATHERMVVLRLDDVQAYGWTDISIRMMEDALDSGFSMTAGVIPGGLMKDKRITRFISKHDCHIEYALHGYDNEYNIEDVNSDGEFAHIDGATAKAKLLAGRKILAKYSKQTINVFIPPHNQLSTESKRVLAEEGLPIVSSEGDAYFDYHTSTYRFDTNTFIKADTVISDCETRFSEGKDLCVIMLHPQDFDGANRLVDEDLYKEYTQILHWLTEKEYSVVTMNEVLRRKMENHAFTENIDMGTTHEDVKRIQEILNKLGYTVATSGPGAPGSETNHFGPQTRDALAAFQTYEGLEIITSRIDEKTRDRLIIRSLDLY